MEKSFVNNERTFVTNGQSPPVAQPGEGAFDFPPMTVAAQCTTVLSVWFDSIVTMGTNHLNTASLESVTQRIAVVTTVYNQTSNLFWPRGHASQRALAQRYFGRRGRGKLASQRNTLAVDHHHPLCALAPLGFANAVAPFLAGAKLPSINTWLQSRVPCRSNCPMKARHNRSHTPCCSQSRNRRQQVAGLGYRAGKSRQRAPVLSTHKMPSTTCRSSQRGRPIRPGLGNHRWSRFHCRSLRNISCIPSFSQKWLNLYSYFSCFAYRTFETSSSQLRTLA